MWLVPSHRVWVQAPSLLLAILLVAFQHLHYMPVYLYCIATSSGLGPSFWLTLFRSSPSFNKIFPLLFDIHCINIHIREWVYTCYILVAIVRIQNVKNIWQKRSLCVVCVQRCSDLCRSEAWSSELNALLNVDNFNKSYFDYRSRKQLQQHFFSSVPELNRFFRLTNIITVVTFKRVVPCYDEAGVME